MTSKQFLRKCLQDSHLALVENPILWHHFNQESGTKIWKNNFTCSLCFTKRQPKLVIKSKRLSKQENKGKKLARFFCKVCKNKIPELTSELSKVDKKAIKSEVVKLEEPKIVKDTKMEKKKKKKDLNAGLVIPDSLKKKDPATSAKAMAKVTSVAKSAQFMKMLGQAEKPEEHDRLKCFLKL